MDINELAEKIQKEFDVAIKHVPGVSKMFSDTAAGITYADASEFARMSGETIGRIAFNNMADMFPEGVISLEDAQALIPPALRQNYGYVSQVAQYAQETLNREAGIGLKAMVPEFDAQRASGLAKEISGMKNFITSEDLIKLQFQNASMHIVDQSVQENAKVQERAGLDVTVIRTYDGEGLHGGKDPCEWCIEREGVWSYSEAQANGVFQRHPGCGCEIIYITKRSVEVQTDWTHNTWERISERRA